MNAKKTMGKTLRWALFCLSAGFGIAASAQTTLPLQWGQTQYFEYRIENVAVTPSTTTAGKWNVKVIFSVYNPKQQAYWDIKAAEPFTKGSLTLDIAWNPKTDFTNTGSTGAALAPLVSTPTAVTQLGSGAALPVQVRSLTTTSAASPCTTTAECPNVAGVGTQPNLYWVSKDVTPVPASATAGRVAIEGRPVCAGTQLVGCPAPIVTATSTTYANIPVRSATADFTLPTSASLAAMLPNQRRQIVDIAKCKGCHDDQTHGDVVVPRLSLHGANRNENLDLCVTCHNPNQTDVPYRYSEPADPRIGAAETPIDFKVMVHSIHAGGFRTTPYIVIGRNGSVNDFSGVRFPSELRKSCLKCHTVDASGRGSFELPLKSTVLGTTIKTQSVYQVALGAQRTIDVDPANDTRISPTAATCSACHTKSETRSHMIRTGGASFATTQDKIGVTVIERCASCHGPGKVKDVRKVHELGSGS